MNEPAAFRRKGRATILDVARVAGVSDATVSRALNKPETVSARTRDRVQAAIKDTGYVPNPLAKAMVSGRTFTVGALVPTLNHAIFSKFLNALEDTLSQSGFSLVVAVTEGDGAVEVEKARKLLAMGIEGLVVSGMTHNAGLVDECKRFAIPLVATSYYQPSAAIPTIGYDNEVAAKLAATHLAGLGHETVAVWHGPVADNDRTRSRLKGLKEVAEDTGLTFHFTETSLDYAGGAAAQIDPSATALLCLSDVLAMGAMFTLQGQGVRVPDDLSVMGFDDMEPSAFLSPPLTTVRLPIADMGHTTGQAICDYLQAGQPIAPRELSADLVIRQSTGPVSQPRVRAAQVRKKWAS